MNTIFRYFFLVFCFIGTLPLQSWADDHTQLLKDIMFDAPSGDEERITFTLSSDHLPKVFAIKGEKPRIVFDFPDTRSASTLNNIIDTNGNLIKKIRIGIHEGAQPKTRVVLDIAAGQELGFKQKFDATNHSLVVSFQHVADKQVATKPMDSGPSVTPPSVTKVEKATATSIKPAAKQQQNITATSAKPAAKQQQNTTATSAKPAEKQIKKATAKPVTVSKDETVTTKQPPVLESIKFDASSNRGEMILFKLNDFYPPIVFGLEESLPRVVCDFMNTTAAATVPNVIKCDGEFIKAVRVGRHSNPNKVRIVLDLEPNNNYDLQQVFFKEDNLFVIIVNTLTEAAETRDD